MEFFIKKPARISIVFGVIVLTIIGFFDPALAIGLLWLATLTIITVFLLSKNSKKSRIPHLLFFIALLIHLAMVLFIYWTHFEPFGQGADYDLYHYNGKVIASRLIQGNFSSEGLHVTHFYSYLIGIIYFFTLPEMIIPQLLTAWLAAVSCLLAYFIVLETGASKKWAFLIGLITAVYPSYLYFGSLLLKDTLVIPLVLSGVLFCLKLIKRFSWQKFLIFYIVLGLIFHFRFYVGYSLLLVFIFSWFLLGKTLSEPVTTFSLPPDKKRWQPLKKKLVYSLIIIFLLGFLPQISGYGYYAIKPIKYYLNSSTITAYREVHYAPVSEPIAIAPTVPIAPATPIAPTSLAKRVVSKILPQIKEKNPANNTGTDSSIVIKTALGKTLDFIFSSFQSFICVLFGPLPWQIRYYSQLIVLLETLPWCVLFIFIIKGAFLSFKRYHLGLILLAFGLLSVFVLSFWITNFGIAARIRIPSFISLLCLIPLGFFKKNENKKLGL